MAPIYPVYMRDGNGNIMIDEYGFKMYDTGDGRNGHVASTDGLVNTVSDQEMLFEVLHDGDIESCLDHLLQISLRRGAPDNITAVLLMNE